MSDIRFVDTDSKVLLNSLIASYEKITGKTLYPASPERLFILWITDILVQERCNLNYAAQQNLPSYAVGENLDKLAQLFHNIKRLPAKPAQTQMRFTISVKRDTATLVPKGTRCSVGKVVFLTIQDVYIPSGELSATCRAVCETAGEIGNDFTPGQIKDLVDVFPYYESCENVTTSSGGSDIESDSELRARMKASEDTYSTAGSIGAYEYYAKNAIAGVSDIVATSPSPGNVRVFALMDGGEAPNAEELSTIEDAISADDVRPLTDKVTVTAPDMVGFDIDLTYYIPSESKRSAADIESAVNKAVDDFVTWQTEKIGRDINPSELISRLMSTGVKRCVVRSPVFTYVGVGTANENAQVAKFGSRTIVNGGFEDE